MFLFLIPWGLLFLEEARLFFFLGGPFVFFRVPVPAAGFCFLEGDPLVTVVFQDPQKRAIWLP